MKKKSLIKVIVIAIFLILLVFTGFFIDESFVASNFDTKSQPPSFIYLFGTDHLGRNVFYRTLKGLSNSLILGLGASFLSAILALFVGISAGVFPKAFDNVIGFIIDLLMSIPHLVLLILISFCVGRGMHGVIIGLIFSHWTGLARIIRGEILSLKEEPYIKISHKLGNSNFYIIKNHMIPHLIPQFIIGTVLLFPHAILHESSITFLGFGLPPESSAIGIMLSESMSYLQAGNWWLFLPGICLAIVVLLFDSLGKNLKYLLSNDNFRG